MKEWIIRRKKMIIILVCITAAIIICRAVGKSIYPDGPKWRTVVTENSEGE